MIRVRPSRQMLVLEANAPGLNDDCFLGALQDDGVIAVAEHPAERHDGPRSGLGRAEARTAQEWQARSSAWFRVRRRRETSEGTWFVSWAGAGLGRRRF